MTKVFTVSIGKGNLEFVGVDVGIRPGLPRFVVGGLATHRAPETRERLRNACKSSKLPWPQGRVTVSLVPVGNPKHGSLLELGIVAALFCSRYETVAYLGSVGIQGNVMSAPGMLGALSYCARHKVAAVVPKDAERLAGLVPGLVYATVSHIRELLQAPRFIQSDGASTVRPTRDAYLIDTILGHQQVKRALLIALAGKHPLLLWGPVGSGKTALVEASLELLPPFGQGELLDATERAAKQGLDLASYDRQLVTVPITSSVPQLLGKSGHWSSATGGLLFLDELPEYCRASRESLRAPLQALLGGKPGPAVVIAAGNLRKCGNTGTNQRCTCSGSEAARYRQSLGAALLDRFALHVQVPWQAPDDWGVGQCTGKVYAETIARIWNDKATRQNMQVDSRAENLLHKAVEKLRLSGRSRILVVEVAKTIAVIEKEGVVLPEHISEALQYRMRVN